MRKLLFFLMSAIFLLGAFYSLAELELGMSRANVVDVLGEPQGLIASGGYERLTYARGFVELRDGEVTAYELMSESELEEHLVQSALRREEQLRRAEEQRRARIERGRKHRESLFHSLSYARASGAEKLELIRRFRRSYPEIDVSEFIDPAVEQKRAELKEQQEAERIAKLEKRIEEAEWRAQQAEWAASAARVNAQDAMRANYYLRNRHVSRSWQHYPRNFGVSVGYDSPDINVIYRSGGGILPSRGQHQIRNVNTGTSMHSVAGDRIRNTSSTVRFNDGLE